MLHQWGRDARASMSIVPLLILISVFLWMPWLQLKFVLIPPVSAATSSSGAFPQAGVDGVPASVEQLTIAFDGWGGDVIDPWQYIGTGMMQSYLNLRLLHRDEQMNIVPLWATEWRQTNEGIYLTLNPKARWQDGTPAAAEDLKANIEAQLGKYAPAFKGTPRSGQFKRVVQEVQIIDPHHVLIKTEMPDPSFFWLLSASSYWKEIGVDLTIVQHDPTEFYTRVNRPDRAYRPMTLVTWGRQEAGEYIAEQAASSGGGRAVYNERTDVLAKELTRTLDEATRLRLMAEIEDEVLRNHWVIPLYDASAVYGYSDRVLAHPIPEYGAHFTDLNRIVLKK